MFRCNSKRFWLSIVLLSAMAVLLVPAHALAQNCNGYRVQQVGGVSINADGVLALPDSPITKEMRDQIRKEMREAAAELNRPVTLRKISLRAIEDAVASSDKNVTFQLPEEIRFLAGIQRIQYILVYPDLNDIVLAGPGEGWKIDERANIVGQTTGRPVLQLEDLVVALRSVDAARQGGISVSIDPTPEGRQQFEKFMRAQKQFTPAVVGGIEKAMGSQQVTITGVPATSRFARLLTASDYKMKR